MYMHLAHRMFTAVRSRIGNYIALRKKGSLNTNLKSERNFADDLTRCSSLPQGESIALPYKIMRTGIK